MKKLSLALLTVTLLSEVAVADSNPASITYVNHLFNEAVQRGTYTAGTAISILNNVISGNYQAGSGITITGNTITATGSAAPYTAGTAINITNNVISGAYTVSNGLGINGADILGYTSGTGVTVNGAGGGATPASLDVNLISGNAGITISDNTITETQLEIGQLYQGGIIFYLDSTNRHGLAIALNDSANNAVFTTKSVVYAPMTGIGAGAINTAVMLAAETSVSTPQTASSIATARAVTADGLTSCLTPTGQIPTLTETCYGDWYIPSIGEFQQLQLAGNTSINDAVLAAGGSTFLDINYWSSSTTTASGTNGTNAFDVVLNTDNTINGDNGPFTDTRAVRTIRAF